MLIPSLPIKHIMPSGTIIIQQFFFPLKENRTGQLDKVCRGFNLKM